MIRLFAALPIPADAARRLALLQGGLDGRAVAPETFHLTLVFFGELPGPAAEELHHALSAIEAPRFSFWLDGVGAFGGRKPTALYAAVRPEPALERLQAKVAQAARRAGVAIDARRFTPHVTLVRFAAGALSAEGAARALSARGAFLAGPIAADDFTLFRSDLGRGGPAYTPLARYPLRAASAAGSVPERPVGLGVRAGAVEPDVAQQPVVERGERAPLRRDAAPGAEPAENGGDAGRPRRGGAQGGGGGEDGGHGGVPS